MLSEGGGGGAGGPDPEKSRAATCIGFLKYSGTDLPREAIGQRVIASRGWSVRPSVKYVDDKKKIFDPRMRFKGYGYQLYIGQSDIPQKLSTVLKALNTSAIVAPFISSVERLVALSRRAEQATISVSINVSVGFNLFRRDKSYHDNLMLLQY